MPTDEEGYIPYWLTCWRYHRGPCPDPEEDSKEDAS